MCLHKPEFHTFSADESKKDKKVTSEELLMPNRQLELITGTSKPGFQSPIILMGLFANQQQIKK
jgi:hypothetical protein